ncbi:MAG UNVERIFIED_CONTAM: hypothetical protein LVR18_17595 [Planctomycetaceae bacterium]
MPYELNQTQARWLRFLDVAMGLKSRIELQVQLAKGDQRSALQHLAETHEKVLEDVHEGLGLLELCARNALGQSTGGFYGFQDVSSLADVAITRLRECERAVYYIDRTFMAVTTRRTPTPRVEMI